MSLSLLLPFVIFSTQALPAQSPIGTVSVSDADVAAPMQVIGGKALLPANTTITAHDHTAEVDLEHHGLVLVCATTALHVAESQAGSGPQVVGPLMLSMDRGALELRIQAHPGDVLMTPDLRIQSTSTAPLDLQIRVARNGDTCVENRGPSAEMPTLEIHEQFGDGIYLLHPGQHVLFNNGSLRQVVDNETQPCGCPPTSTSLQSDAAGKTSTNNIAEKFPFPLAQSEGLAPTPPPTQPKPGETQVTLSANMHFDGNNPPPAEPPKTIAATPASPPQQTGFFQSIGHFFKKIFGGK